MNHGGWFESHSRHRRGGGGCRFGVAVESHAVEPGFLVDHTLRSEWGLFVRDEPILRSVLESAGFSNIVRRDLNESDDAALVGKFHEFVYLAASDRIVCWPRRGNERYETGGLSGGTLLTSPPDQDRAGGWRNAPRRVDEALREDVVRAGGRLYCTHGAGFMLVRHGRRHTWDVSDDFFLAHADRISGGWNPALAGIEGLKLPHPGTERPD